MITIQEYKIPNEQFKQNQKRLELIDGLERAVKNITIENKKKIEMLLSVVYYKKYSANELRINGYNNKEFSRNDEIQIAVLRADIAVLLKNFPQRQIDGIDFTVELLFGDNPNKDLPVMLNDNKKNNNEGINILPVDPRFTLKQMILSDAVSKQLNDVITLVKMRKKIYENWGFAEVDPIPRAIINFFGSPGTGKTMAAHALASEFGIKILALNYADIESKYVGDAPKNLMSAFKIAKEHNALLFFDEADSFLGKRISNVTQSADQAVNSLRSQLLMLLEEFDGIVVFATNLIENYDKAFNSRISNISNLNYQQKNCVNYLSKK